jgi:hypothetical protein
MTERYGRLGDETLRRAVNMASDIIGQALERTEAGERAEAEVG